MVIDRNTFKSVINSVGLGSKFRDGFLSFRSKGNTLSMVLYCNDKVTKLSVCANNIPYTGELVSGFTLEFSDVKKFIKTSDKSSIRDNKENICIEPSNRGKTIALHSNISIQLSSKYPHDRLKEDEVMKDCNYSYDNLKIPHPILASSGLRSPMHVLNGIFLDFENGKMVGTDSLSMCMTDIKKGGDENLILPRSIVIPDTNITNISVGENTISVHYDTLVLTTTSFRSKYVDYNSVIPVERTAHIKFNGLDVKEFLSSSEGSSSFTATFTYGKMRLETSDQMTSYPTFRMDFDCSYPHDNSFVLNFNRKHFLDSITTNNCAIVINHNNSAFFILDEYETVIVPSDYREGTEIAIEAVSADDNSVGFVYKENVITPSKISPKRKKEDEVLLLKQEIATLKKQLEDANEKIDSLTNVENSKFTSNEQLLVDEIKSKNAEKRVTKESVSEKPKQ